MEENNDIPDISLDAKSEEPKKSGVDPKSLILPNKEVHSLDSAQRVSAGALYENERSAVLPKAPPAPPLPAMPKVGTESVAPLETFQGDIQKYVGDKNVTPVKAVAAEEERRASAGEPIAPAPEGEHAKRTGVWFQLTVILVGVVCIMGALGTMLFVFSRQAPLPAPATPVAPFISVDGTANIELHPGDTRSIIMQELVDAKAKVGLPFGLIGQLRPVLATSSGYTLIPTQQFMSVFVPNMPPELLRSLEPYFLLGVHVYDVNQPFLILNVDSYQSGYAGMLAWEKTMRADLLPLFDEKAPPHAQLTIGTSTTPVPITVGSGFVDTIVENHDARAIENSYGDILFLWTFIDRTTILITTNTATVHEVITRLKNAPTISVPGQQ